MRQKNVEILKVSEIVIVPMDKTNGFRNMKDYMTIMDKYLDIFTN